MSREPSPNSRVASGLTLLASHMLQRSSAPQYLMIVLLLAVFTLNPLPSSHIASRAHNGRTLNALDSLDHSEGDWLMLGGLWTLRILLTLLTFGWFTLTRTPSVSSDSTQAVAYWRLTKQAHKDVQNVCYVSYGMLSIVWCALYRVSLLLPVSVLRSHWLLLVAHCPLLFLE